MSIAKKLASQTAVYGVSSIVGRVLTYFLVPIYTGAFAAAEYGVVTGLYAYVSFLNVVFTYGMETTYFRFANRPGTDRRELYDRSLSLLLLSSAGLALLLMALARPLLGLLDIGPGYERYFYWVALILAFDAVSAIPFARLRLENQARKFATIKMTGIVVNVALNLFFIVLCPAVASGKWLPALGPLVARVYDPGLGVGYVFLANLVASAATLLLLGRELLDFRFRFSWGPLQPLLKYAYPLMLMGLAGMVNETFDRVLLAQWLPTGFYPGQSSLTAVGIYGACYKLSIFMSLVIQAFRYAAEPFFFAQSTEKNSPATFALVLKWFTLCCAVIFVAISLNVEDFGALFLKRAEYRQGLAVVPVLLLANLFLGVYYNISFWFKLSDKTQYGTLITVVGLVVTVAGNLLLIPVIGYMGCAVAFLASSFVMMVLCYYLGERHYPVPYDVRSAVGYVLGAGVLIGLAWQFPIANIWVAVPVHLALFGLFFLVVLLVERATWQPVLARFRQRKARENSVNNI